MGRSGGGPHALACAALLPERLTRAAVLVGIAPRGTEGLDWYDGMSRSNILEHTAAATGYEGLAALTEATAKAVRADPASLLASLQADMPDPDRRVVADRGIRAILLETYAEALRTSAYGWIDDALRSARPGDRPRPPSPSPGCSGTVRATTSSGEPSLLAGGPDPQRGGGSPGGAAHFGALDVLPDILAGCPPSSARVTTGHPPRPAAQFAQRWRLQVTVIRCPSRS